MTIQELRRYHAGAKVLWHRQGDADVIGTVRVADPANRKSARWIEWSDGKRTEDYDDWALQYVQGYYPTEAAPPSGIGM